MENFPKILINNIHNSEGQNKKAVVLSKAFLTTKKELFLPLKEKKFAETILSSSKYKTNGYIAEIIFHGLNYSAKRKKMYRKKFLVDVHKSEILICKEPLTTTVKSRIYKRRLVFFSFDKQKINHVEKYLKEFKEPNSYTGKGLFSRTDKYKIKKVNKKKKK
jgi:hypothetical protein